MDTLAIIKRIEMRLSELGMSKAEFYSRSGISSASFSQWRAGTYKPSTKKLERAADVLSVPVGYLIGTVTMNDDGCTFSDGSGYGGGCGAGAGFGDGSGYGGPILKSNTAYGRAAELCTIYTVNNMSFHDICQAAGLDDQAIHAWKNGKLPERAVLEKIAEHLLVPVDCLLEEESKKAPTENGERKMSDADLKFALWGDCEDISDDDLADVRRYAAFVRERKKDLK